MLLALAGCSAAPTPQTNVFDLAVGDCFDDSASGGTATGVDEVDCAEPHDFEVYASESIDATEFPGASQVAVMADARCLAAFEAFVGIPRSESRYAYATMYPTSDSWAGGDRVILCRIASVDDEGGLVPTTGSLEGVEQ